MKFTIFVFIIFSTVSLFCQDHEINKDISWITETDFEYFLEQEKALNFYLPNPNNGLEKAISSIETIKLDIKKSDAFPNRYFTETIMNLVLNGKIKTYSLDENTELTKKEIQQLTILSDTIIAYDIKSYEKVSQVVRNDYSNKINSFLIKQRWKYNDQNESLTSEVIGIIPVLHFKNKKIKLFWIPFKNNNQGNSVNFNDPELIWIKMTADRVSFNQSSDQKGNTSNFLETKIWQKAINQEIKIYDVENSLFFTKELPDNYIAEKILETQIDTIITFDPETYKENVQVVKTKGVKYNHISGYKLYQIWYFNIDQLTLNSKLVGIAPLINIEDFKGEVQSYRPLFNVRY